MVMKLLDEQTVVSIQEVLLYFDRDRYMDKPEGGGTLIQIPS
jgi:hypothetical protein